MITFLAIIAIWTIVAFIAGPRIGPKFKTNCIIAEQTPRRERETLGVKPARSAQAGQYAKPYLSGRLRDRAVSVRGSRVNG